MRTGCPMHIVTVLPRQKQLGKGHSKGLSRKARHRLEIIDWYNQVSERKSQSGLKDASLTCRHFGIERSYFYRWYGRFKKHGIAGLENRTSRPKRVRRETVGAEIGRSFQELRDIIDRVEEPWRGRLGVCMDTCHLHDAGYDIINDLEGVLTQFDKEIGLERLRACHLNDSMNPGGSRKDRHARIGEGHIGLEALVRVASHPVLRDLPFVLETPNELPGYAAEIKLLRERRVELT